MSGDWSGEAVGVVAKAQSYPNSVREIAEVIGLESALLLIGKLPRVYAGKEGAKSNRVILYVPKRLPVDHQLVRILGWARAKKLVATFGGEILYPANCNHVVSAWKAREARRMFAAGVGRAELVEMMGVCDRQMRNWLAAATLEKPQEDLSFSNDNAGLHDGANSGRQ